MSGVYKNAGQPFYARVRDFQRSVIRGALRKSHGNQVKAAALLGVNRNTLARYCDQLGIDPSAFYTKRDHERYQAQHGWRARE
jgi:two-component system, NtrC family, nitrogen regulation response regulator GlnG